MPDLLIKSFIYARPKTGTTEARASLVRSVPPYRGDERGRTNGQARRT